MRRARLSSAIVIASTALSFGVMCLWSYTSTIDTARVGFGNTPGLFASVLEGQVRFGRTYPPRRPTRVEWERMIAIHIPANHWAFVGFEFQSGEYQTPVRITRYWRAGIPLWCLALLLSLPGVVWLRRWYRGTRQARVGFEVTSAHR